MRREGVRSLSIVGAAAETGLRGSVRHAAGPYALATPFAFSYVRKPPRPSMPASSVMSALRSRSGGVGMPAAADPHRSEEHTSELQSLMRISYAVFCLKKKHVINIAQLHNAHTYT